MRVKICGVCEPADAAAAARAGATYVGVILAPGFVRSQTTSRAATIYAAGDDAARVGVFVDGAPGEVVSTAERLSLSVLQLHGSESARAATELAAAGPWDVWKVLRPRRRGELAAGIQEYAGVVDGLVLDGWSPVAVGGTGARVPWQEIAGELAGLADGVALILAGGLTPDNVGDAVAWVRPHVVDVSSGVELRPGRKDPARLRAFVEAATGRRSGSGEEPR